MQYYEGGTRMHFIQIIIVEIHYVKFYHPQYTYSIYGIVTINLPANGWSFVTQYAINNAVLGTHPPTLLYLTILDWRLCFVCVHSTLFQIC